MIVAVDTSALGKLLVEEDESGPFREQLAQHAGDGDEFTISTIAVTELRRLAIRLGIDALRVEPVVRPFRTIRLTEAILQLAGRLPQAHLGTLDAIHIATALSIGAGALVSYDLRQLEAAAQEGLLTVSPGS
ncbi:type II toxin-antitoxin system VapC family toxin [Rathayibacter soli]|uniref:type II toxin-antitoxin system VapC family toxin n=1 Tax=Rathayibacter soli TaxID=3144168 RepID=UPI0027E5AE57|nr:type II toxin-antitoxin system VapC family toxin [Glaciibacter superstes]